MFESISESLGGFLDRIRSRGRLTEKNIADGLRDVRAALLSADVNYKVVKEFIERVTDQAVGEQVINSIDPSQQIVKIVHDELVRLMGESDTRLEHNQKGPTVIMMVGLQGSGKTTTCGKLAQFLKKKGHRPLLVAADVQRPAAIDQLEILGKTLEIEVYSERGGKPVNICNKACRHADRNANDVVVLDTAGRLHIDDQLMAELEAIRKGVAPQNIFLVTDAMTGQDAVNSAREFNSRLDIDGVILTKMDGDARGGAALSIRTVTGKPVKFIGTGEKLDDLEEFHPDRMASRILGMGDIVSLVERAAERVDQEKAEKLQKKFLKATFTLDDFYQQMQQVKRIGPLGEILKMIPGMGKLKDVQFDESELVTIEAIILSMTPDERHNPHIIGSSRKKRIARGSGTSVQDVNQLLSQFKQMRKMMKSFKKFGTLKGLPGMGEMDLSALGLGDLDDDDDSKGPRRF